MGDGLTGLAVTAGRGECAPLIYSTQDLLVTLTQRVAGEYDWERNREIQVNYLHLDFATATSEHRDDVSKSRCGVLHQGHDIVEHG